MNPRVNGTGLTAKTLVTLRKEGVQGMGAAWGWLCRSGGVRIVLLLVAGGDAS